MCVQEVTGVGECVCIAGGTVFHGMSAPLTRRTELKIKSCDDSREKWTHHPLYQSVAIIGTKVQLIYLKPFAQVSDHFHAAKLPNHFRPNNCITVFPELGERQKVIDSPLLVYWSKLIQNLFVFVMEPQSFIACEHACVCVDV